MWFPFGGYSDGGVADWRTGLAVVLFIGFLLTVAAAATYAAVGIASLLGVFP